MGELAPPCIIEFLLDESISINFKEEKVRPFCANTGLIMEQVINIMKPIQKSSILRAIIL
jgi:hypothetical protein